MIAWLLTSWPGQALAVVAALWFLNGLRKAMFKPRLTYISHQVAKRSGWNGHDGYFVTIERQQLLPPVATSQRDVVREHGRDKTP